MSKVWGGGTEAAGVLTCNLYKIFTSDALAESWSIRRAGRVRHAFGAVAGKVVSAGGQSLLRVGRDACEMSVRGRRAVALTEGG
jgi:hypothetical protein